jgi:hypothetical protein
MSRRGLSAARARRLLEAMRSARVLVLGDVMLDEFLWGKVARISPEAPVPVVEVQRQSHHLGGAGNVACNLRSLGAQAVVAGVVGRDAAAETLRGSLRAAGVEDALCVERSLPRRAASWSRDRESRSVGWGPGRLNAPDPCISVVSGPLACPPWPCPLAVSRRWTRRRPARS